MGGDSGFRRLIIIIIIIIIFRSGLRNTTEKTEKTATLCAPRVHCG